MEEMSKKELRRIARVSRDRIPESVRKSASEIIARNLTALPEYAEAKRIFSFLSFGSEADTEPFMRQAAVDGKEIFVPRMEGAEIRFYRYSGREGLVMHRYGLLEPAGTEESAEAESGDLILVPGLVYSPEGYRLGYGGGFYDRYLAGHPDAVSAGYAFAGQRGELTPEPFDVRLQILVTENGCVRF